MSCPSLYRLDELGLEVAIENGAAEMLVEELPHLCRVMGLDGPDFLRRAARLAHDHGLAMANAIVPASLIESRAWRLHD